MRNLPPQLLVSFFRSRCHVLVLPLLTCHRRKNHSRDKRAGTKGNSLAKIGIPIYQRSIMHHEGSQRERWSGQVENAITVDHLHLCCMIILHPIVIGSVPGLEDTEAVNPEVLDIEAPECINCISKALGQYRYQYVVSKLFVVVRG